MMAGLRFRNSIKAVIIRDGRLLVTVNKDPWGEFLLLPGGGQEFGETMTQALERECREELSCAVIVGDLLGIREYIGAHQEFAATDSDIHQVEVMFACELAPGCEPHIGDCADDEGDWAQTGVMWVPLGELSQHRIYPAALREWLPTLPEPKRRYLGDVN